MNLNTLVLLPTASVRLPLERALRRRGHAVTWCADAEKAVAAYDPERHPLVVAEVPPDRAGATPLHRLRQALDAHRSLLVAAVPPGTPEAFQVAIAAGADEVLDTVSEDALDGRLTLIEQRLHRLALRAAEYRQQHHQAEAARAAVQRYLGVAGGLFVEIGRDGRVRLINREGCRLLGRPEEEILGTNWFERFIPPRQRADVEAIHRAFMVGEVEAPEWAENHVLTASGEERCIAWHNATLRDERGRITSTLSSGQDVTEKRRAEATLRRQANVLDQVHDAVVSVDLAGHVTSWNRGAERLTGYAAEEMLGNPILKLFPDAERDFLRDEVARPLEQRETHAAEVRLRKRSGEAAIVHVLLSLLRDEAGEPVGVIGSSIDITRRKRAAEALRESEARARAILETTVDAVITIDERGRIESFNQAATRIFGYSAEEAIGRNVKILMPEPYRSEHDSYLEAYHTTGRRKIIGIGREVVGRRNDGTTFPIDLAVSEVDLGDRRIFTGIIRDLTEQKRLEREVVEISAQERQRLGQDLHDGLGSHLTGVALSCRALSRRLEKGKPVHKEDVDEIAQLVQEGAEQARMLSRGLNPIKLTNQGLVAALAELATTMQKLSGVACLFQSDEHVPPQDTETTLHLYRIAQEAINNAIKHARPTHVWIRLTYENHAIRLTVRDDGVGLPASLEAAAGIGHRVMEYRAYHIGATFSLANAPGGGAVVMCTLPLGEADRAVSAAALHHAY